MNFFAEGECQAKKKRNKEKCDYSGRFDIPHHDFSAADDECDLCGSHGHISVTLKCPKCGEFFEVEIQTW